MSGLKRRHDNITHEDARHTTSGASATVHSSESVRAVEYRDFGTKNC